MIRYFLRSLRAQLTTGRSLYLLSVLGVALGVASVVSIRILNHNALAAFRGGVRAVSGDADLTVLGVSESFADSLYPTVLGDPSVASAWPIHRVGVSLSSAPEVFLDVIGTDLLGVTPMPLESAPSHMASGSNTPPASASEAGGEEAGGEDAGDEEAGVGEETPLALAVDAIRVPGWVAVTPRLAAERGWALGDSFGVTSGSRRVTLTVGAVVDFQKYAPLASRYLAVMDVSQAQAFLGRSGRLHQIDVVLKDGTDVEASRTRLARVLGPSVRVETPGERVDDAAGLLGAFRLNLTALSLISLFVGAFLIFSSTQASLVRRRGELGLLRSLGTTRAQTSSIVLGEVALLGAVGVAIGLPIGYWAAQENVHFVSATLTNIYLLSAIERLEVPVSVFVTAGVVGIGSALLGAILPAWDAAKEDPRSLLVAYQVHESTGRFSGTLAVLGLGVLLISWSAYFAIGVFGVTSRYSGFGLGLALLIGLPLLTPWTVRTLTRNVPARGFGLSLSLRNLATRLQTTAFSVASLAIAVSMMVGITLLVGSFRETLRTWVDGSIRADVYVTTESWTQGGAEAFLTNELRDALSNHPSVLGVESLRRLTTRRNDRRLPFAGVSLGLPDSCYAFPMRSGNAMDALAALRSGNAALISEPLSRLTGLGVGDELEFDTPTGTARLEVAGVSYDYSTEGGSVLVSLETLNRLFGAAPIQNIALFLAPEADPEVVVSELRAKTAGAPLLIRSNRSIREEVFRIFDQTFAITRLLQGMALLVAACGISLTLLVLARERIAELALYRSLGAVRPQIFGLFVGEGLSLAALGLLLGTVGGLVLAAILIYVINPSFFGWTIRPAWSWAAWVEQSVTLLSTAVLASLYPALRASRVPAQELSRENL